MKKKTRFVIAFFAALMILFSLFSGCNSLAPVNPSTASSATAAPPPSETQAPVQTTAAPQPSAAATVPAGLLAWYYPFPHPFGAACKVGIDAYVKETGVPVNVVIGPEFTMTSEIESIEAMMAQGYKYFGIFSCDAAAANGLYEEMVKKGCQVNNIGWDSAPNSVANFVISTDIEKSAEMEMEYVAKLINYKGSIMVCSESTTDSAIQLRHKGIDKILAKYPDMKVGVELTDMLTVEACTTKIGDALSANAGKVDGIVSLGYTCTQALCNVLSDIYQKGTKHIAAVGVDSDEVIAKNIKDGVFDATCVQNPYGIGYISGEVMKLEYQGWTPKSGMYHIDTGAIMADKSNIDSTAAAFTDLTNKIISTLTTNYMEKK
jgi:ABC-type sugar transport system substrate-binding protein